MKVTLILKAAMPQKEIQMVEHEVAMAIHHLTRTEIVAAISWLHQAQDKMDAARDVPPRYRGVPKKRSPIEDMTDQGKWDAKYGRGAK